MVQGWMARSEALRRACFGDKHALRKTSERATLLYFWGKAMTPRNEASASSFNHFLIEFHSKLITRSDKPFSPRTILSFPALAIFSKTSSSRKRIRVGFSASNLAVLA